MKFSSVIFALLFLFSTSVLFAEKEKVSTWKCKDWEKADMLVDKARTSTKQVPVKKKPVLIPQKIKDIEPEKVLCPKQKLNTIFLEPMFYLMYHQGTHRSVVAPGLGISYVRELTPKFSLGVGALYVHAVYGTFPNRTFNMYGGKVMLGFKF